MIPKIIHQTYKTHNIPYDLRNWHQKVKALHPNWEVKLWTDQDNLELVEQHFPYMLEVYHKLPYNIMRVDMVRCMYMIVYGGVYLDLDYELFRPLDETIVDINLLLPLAREKQRNDFYKTHVIIGNCIFASKPNHVFWQDVLSELYNHPPIQHFANKIDIFKLTGPEFITKIYFQNPIKYQAALPKKDIFHPDMLFAKKWNYQQWLLKNGTIGLRHCKESWLKENNSMKNNVARVKASVERRVNYWMYTYKSYLYSLKDS